jgi:hypothetical protein
MNLNRDRRSQDRPRITCWEIIDVELAHVFWAATAGTRDDYKNAIEMIGHRAIVKEVKS